MKIERTSKAKARSLHLLFNGEKERIYTRTSYSGGRWSCCPDSDPLAGMDKGEKKKLFALLHTSALVKSIEITF